MFIQSIIKLFYYKIVFISITILLFLIFSISMFNKIYILEEISFTLFDETITIPNWIWALLKNTHHLSVIISWSFISYTFYPFFIPKENINLNIDYYDSSGNIDLLIGTNLYTGEVIKIPEKGLYQNVLITGTIGTGKTSSAMYPFVNQFLEYGLGMLILDVKGNFHAKVLELNKRYNRRVIVIELNGKYTYNPLDKPNIKPSILANRLKTILTLFSNQHATDSYWLDKVELYLTECIKLCRLYNNEYVTFIELHKLVNDPSYLEKKISTVKDLFISNNLNSYQIYDFNTCLDFFQNEFKNLDSKILSIIQSEISRITQVFVNDYEVSKAFCPLSKESSFPGFKDLSDSIVVLNMNVAQYRNLSKIIATYLKLDFQTETLMRLASSNKVSPVAFVCDEYHEYATDNDADFFAQSREAKCINIISTQSYTSLLNAVREQSAAKVIIQSLVNKIWYRTDDTYTIEEAQKQLGKEDKTKFSRSISENAKETKFNYVLNTFKSDNSNLSESISTYTQHDYIYDFNIFSRELKTFQTICFLSTGTQIIPPQIVQMIPIHKSHNDLNDSTFMHKQNHQKFI